MNIAIVDRPKAASIPTSENRTVQELIEAHKASVVALHRSVDAQAESGDQKAKQLLDEMQNCLHFKPLAIP
jgi:3-keto-L-gulonate-6-phosphate decarboxylase